MKKIPFAAFDAFFSAFQGDTSDTFCQGCDGLCETSDGFSTTVFLLPGELEFLKSKGIDLSNHLDRFSSPNGIMLGWSLAQTCPFLQNERCILGKGAGIKPIECSVYPVIFKSKTGSSLDVCPICRNKRLFLEQGFVEKASQALKDYIIPYLDPHWLEVRNELNIIIDEDLFHALKSGSTNRKDGLNIEALKLCRINQEIPRAD